MFNDTATSVNGCQTNVFILNIQMKMIYSNVNDQCVDDTTISSLQHHPSEDYQPPKTGLTHTHTHIRTYVGCNNKTECSHLYVSKQKEIMVNHWMGFFGHMSKHMMFTWCLSDPDETMAKSLANGLVDIGFASRYRTQFRSFLGFLKRPSV